jgi:asparagine synthase (glutamine-hydrolysing)
VSVQFGRWNFDGEPVDSEYLKEVDAAIRTYGPDDGGSYSAGNVTILYRAFHTTRESHHQTQPHLTATGPVITWDGRLDNRSDLIRKFDDELTINSSDLAIVAAAYGRCGADCLAMLVGDWALSIWTPANRSVLLAKDPIGTRTLYYAIKNAQLTWSTVLDPLVLHLNQTSELNEEWLAGWFSFFPAAHLTPFPGIQSVPPSCSVLVRGGQQKITRYWDFDAGKKVRYRTDREYEEHFRSVFSQAVRVRLRSDTPVLAELSGGMDSSSIVCVADQVIGLGLGETPRLDTVSYYDDSEPNWDERSYFTKVEEKRGRIGCHVDVGAQVCFTFDFAHPCFAAIPGSSNRSSEHLLDCITRHGNRVVLSGIGGDEVTGGVPTPLPELADLLTSGRIGTLAHQLKAWALNKRKPWLHLFWETIRAFLPVALLAPLPQKRPASWLRHDFVQRNRTALQGYDSSLGLWGPRPSFQENLSTLRALQRQLSCSPIQTGPLCEKRYPYLDRGLLEFLFAIPREQLVRPVQRRSLMRRALVGIVPDEILNRKRKAFVARKVMTTVSENYECLVDLSRALVSASLGIIDPEAFRQALQKVRNGQDLSMVALLRTLDIESWLRGLIQQGMLTTDANPLAHVQRVQLASCASEH